ncbi:MAG TPA: thioredoxin domain-containing protein [Pyrinomonadaceae bacterium]|jgi:thiol-disulfide isomerase/thioredoxin|nr:thioredoxin domain-containing protein [Pyrinomonadaceae bacterium]
MMNSILRRAGIIFSILALTVLVAPAGIAKTKTKRPTVAIIRADWCTACQQLEPTMMELMNQYKDRIDFVMLDVTDDQKTAKAGADARKLGIGKFFVANKKNTSTVIVLSPAHKILFHTAKNFDRDVYVKAFDDAIAKANS